MKSNNLKRCNFYDNVIPPLEATRLCIHWPASLLRCSENSQNLFLWEHLWEVPHWEGHHQVLHYEDSRDVFLYEDPWQVLHWEDPWQALYWGDPQQALHWGDPQQFLHWEDLLEVFRQLLPLRRSRWWRRWNCRPCWNLQSWNEEVKSFFF